MTPPARVLLGRVRRRPLAQFLEGDERIEFETVVTPGWDEEKADAVLVVLEEDQNPKEVAETILWALR